MFEDYNMYSTEAQPRTGVITDVLVLCLMGSTIFSGFSCTCPCAHRYYS